MINKPFTDYTLARHPIRGITASVAMMTKGGLETITRQLAMEKRMLDPSRAFYEQIQSEAETYARLKRGEFDELHNLRGLGHLLIGAHIASGLSRRELADRLGVHESQVSRDERNEDSGITVDRANRILEALGVEITARVKRISALARSA